MSSRNNPKPGDQFVHLGSGWVYMVTSAHFGQVTFTARCGRQNVGGHRKVSLDEWADMMLDAEPLLDSIMRERNLTEDQARILMARQ
jgi:hypothetical protein